MILKIYSLLDTKVSSFAQPFFFSHVGHAVRAVSELAGDRSTVVGRHPGDFVLFELGEFDDQSGLLMPHAKPINMGPALAFLAPPNTQGALFEPRGADVAHANGGAN